MGEKRVIYEEFRSFDHLLSTLASRPNNKYMSREHASQKDDYEWTGTRSYSHACEMLGTGYLDVVKKLQKNVAAANKLNSKFYANIDRPRPYIGVQGYCPCVPNAIRNIPQSMINIDRKPMKRKTLHILYSISGSCMRDTDWFIKCGTALLSAIDIIERAGIQTRIDLNFFSSSSEGQYPFPTIRIKEYGERYSVQKISFPLVHPSMFRRIGFKWLETSPGVDHHYDAYGHPPSYNEMEEVLHIEDPATYLITTDWIDGHGFSVEEILKKFEVI